MRNNYRTSRCIVISIALISGFMIIISSSPLIIGTSVSRGHTQNILLTGFWNPTGQMIQPFSTNKWLNPSGWQGGNWESRGYDIYSYFPTPGSYNGTFQVDYQNTLSDFNTVTSALNPIAIISFGATPYSSYGDWQIEYNARNLNSWVSDGDSTPQPTPNPPDGTVAVNYVRHSSLPMPAIAYAINTSTSLHSYINWKGNPGAYLCEYIAYLGMWYHDVHNTTSDPNRCYTAGFIHVLNTLPASVCFEPVNVTLRETIAYLGGLVPEMPIVVISVVLFIAVFIMIGKVTNRKDTD